MRAVKHRRNRGGRVRPALFAVTVVAVALSACGRGTPAVPESEAGLLALMPPEAPMRFVAGSMDKVVSGIGALLAETADGDSLTVNELLAPIFANPGRGDAAPVDVHAEWRRVGFDTSRPLGFVILDTAPEGGYGLVPVADPDAFLAQEYWSGGEPFPVAVNGEAVPSGHVEEWYWFLANDYAVFSTSEEYALTAAEMMETPLSASMTAREAEALEGAELAAFVAPELVNMLGNPLSRSRQAAQRATSQNNLKQMGLVFKIHASEARGERWPPLSRRPGELMADSRAIYPEYLTDPTVLRNPQVADFDSGLASAPDAEQAVSDHHYFYLGYLIPDDETMEIFALAYRRAADAGEVPSGDLTDNGVTVYQLREGIERFLVETRADVVQPGGTAQMQSRIPVMVERPIGELGSEVNVLFMNGSVKLVPFGEFPNTQAFWTALTSIKRAFDPDYSLPLEGKPLPASDVPDLASASPFSNLLVTVHLSEADGGRVQMLARKKEAAAEVPEALTSLRYLPEGAGLSLAFRMDQDYLNMLSGEEPGSEALMPAGMDGMAAFIQALFHGEAAAAIDMGEAGLPRIRLMVEISQPEVVDMMLGLAGMQSQPLGEHDGVRLRAIAGIPPILGTACFAVDGTTVFGASSEPVLRELLDARSAAPPAVAFRVPNRMLVNFSPSGMVHGPFVDMMIGMAGANPEMRVVANGLRTAPSLRVLNSEEIEYLHTDIHGLPLFLAHFGRLGSEMAALEMPMGGWGF